MTIPNLLTLLRILLIPVLAVVFYLPYDWSGLLCSMIFALAAITDWLDGYLARKLGQASALGAFLDPVADKLMVAVALVLLVEAHPSIWMSAPAAIIIGREITISALREWMAEIGKRSTVAVSMIGKIKTTAQMVALIFLLLSQSLDAVATLNIGLVCLYIAALLTLWSMCLYLIAAWPALMENR